MGDREQHNSMAAEVLDLAALYIDRGWTQGSRARDAHGEPCEEFTMEAVCWCAFGAISAASHRLNVLQEIMNKALMGLVHKAGTWEIAAWNDRGGQRADIVARTIRGGAEWLRSEAAA